MRFRRWPRVTAFEATPLKRAGLARSQRRQRDKLPLLADLIAETQPSADDEMARRAEHWPKLQQKERDERAKQWRRARQRLFKYEQPLCATIQAIWRGCPYPADPVYLLDLLHQIDMGKMDLHQPPWIYFQPVVAPVTPDATRFEEAFRQIGHKKVGGGPKTTEADEFLFCGNLGSGMLILRSRVRLIEPNESFYTCSAHRLRDSHVGRQGHWVDLRVTGECSDADLALITRLAQEADTRPVVVSRETSRRR
jgi:hypothetical protein